MEDARRELPVDENGWATGVVTALPVDRAFSLLSPDASPCIDADRWAQAARTSLRAVITLAVAKRYPSGAMPLADAVLVDVRPLDAEGGAASRVRVVTVPLERAPEVLQAAIAGADAIGGAGFDVLVARGRRLWQIDADVAGDPRAALVVTGLLAMVHLAPVLPPRGGTIFGLKGVRVRLAAEGWRC